MKKFLIFFLFGASIGLSALEFPGVYGDSMVLQRDIEFPFFGVSTPGTVVNLTLEGEKYTATANSHGNWQILLKPHAAGGPVNITVSDGKQTRIFKDVMFGEVWFVSGQSNMAFPLYREGDYFNQAVGGKKAMNTAGNFPELRLCRASFHTESFGPADRHDLYWTRSNPKDAAVFSAVGFLFGRALQLKLEVPVGIICSAFPDTRQEAWLPEDTIRKWNLNKDIAMLDARDCAGTDREKERWQAERKKRQVFFDWKRHGQNGPQPPNFDAKLYKYYGQHFPGTQYNGMIYPFLKFPIRGILWDQGANNVNDTGTYAKMFPVLINEYRARWCKHDFAFLVVQISSWHKHARQNPLPDDFWKSVPPGKSSWAEIREAQERVLDLLPNIGLVVTLDHGDASNIHPRDKQVVADRLIGEAMRLCYNGSTPNPPRFDHVQQEGSSMRVFFRNTGGGLFPRNTRVGNFTLAGRDGVFHQAEALTEGETVVVRCSAVPKPVAVRYAWANFPGDVKLYSQTGIPLGSFRSDNPFVKQ